MVPRAGLDASLLLVLSHAVGFDASVCLIPVDFLARIEAGIFHEVDLLFLFLFC